MSADSADALGGSPQYVEDYLPPSASAPQVHAASIVETASGNVLAVWYGGSHEAAPDVSIYGALLEKGRPDWTDLGVIVDRAATARDLHRGVSRLGNPVLGRDLEGRLRLYWVSATVGGWSFSSVNARTSADDGRTWGPSVRLVTSPFLNLSTLVKGAPILYEDGSIGLPVYHEFIGQFGELLRLDRDDRVLDKTRITWGRTSIQPVIVPFSGKDAVALLRDAGSGRHRVIRSETRDSGSTWSAAEATDLPNPDSAVTAWRLSHGRILLVANPIEKDRNKLSLAVSADQGRTWRVVHTFDEGEPLLPSGEQRQFSYPCLIRAADGRYHLVYTWNKTRIKHVAFNDDWLDEVLKRAIRPEPAGG